MLGLYLRRAHCPDEVRGPWSPDEVLERAPSGDDCLTLRPDDPYVPADRELDRNGALRDVLLAAFPLERAERYAKARFFLLAGLVPVTLLVLLDVQRVASGQEGGFAHLVVDVLSVVVAAVGLAHRYPRHPHVTSAVYGASGLRIGEITAIRCGEVPWVLPAFGALALGCAVATLVLSPSPRAMADHLRRALAMAPPTQLPARSSPGFFRYIFYAVGAAALLPAMLWLLQSSHTSLGLQLVAFVLFALFIPFVGRVFVGREPPVHRTGVADALGTPLRMFRPSARTRSLAATRVGAVAITSLVLSFALVHGAQSTVEGTARVQACMSDSPVPSTALQRFLAAQRAEPGGTPHRGDPSWLSLTVVLVPIAEELVYRGLVQHALRRRLARRWAIGLAALLFGLAHLVAYRSAVYQPMLLGLSFGLAYERAGIFASIVVHMLWNLWLSL